MADGSEDVESQVIVFHISLYDSRSHCMWKELLLADACKELKTLFFHCNKNIMFITERCNKKSITPLVKWGK